MSASVRVQSGPGIARCGGCTRSGGCAVGVVVLRGAVYTMGFERDNFRVIVNGRYLYANSVGCSRTRNGSTRDGSSSRGAGLCVHDYVSLSS